MGQQIGHAENRIPFLLADADLHLLPVLLHDHAVHGKRDGPPLVLADSTVVVGLEVGNVLLLVNRVGF